jgi:hypothetical protein
MVECVSGKPAAGRPRGRRRRAQRFAELLREIGNEQVEDVDGPPEGTFDFGEAKEVRVMTRREQVARVLWTEALKGNLRAAQLIAAYTDGRPVQPADVEAEVRFTADEYGKAAAKVAEWRAARGRIAE